MPEELHILFIESDPVDTMLIREQLCAVADGGYAIEPVRTLEAALELLETREFHVALLDLDLGDPSCVAEFERLHGARPDLPVIVVAERDDPEGTSALLRAGAQDCITKGTLLDALLPRTIRYAIERNQRRIELGLTLRRVSESEARLRALIDANSDAVLLVGMDGAIRFANRAALRMFGKRDLIGADLGRPIGNGIPVELDIQRTDGSQGVAELRVSRTMWNDEEVFLASIRDVTVRVETEQALRKSEQKLILSERHLDTAQRVAELGSFEYDPQSMTCSCSAQLAAMLGLDRHGLVWSEFVERCFPEAARERVEIQVSAAHSGRQTGSHECRFLRAGGSEGVALLRCDWLPGTPELPGRVIGVLRNITELREAQMRQGELEEQLRQSQKLEALGTLAGGIAHDLNNTLAPIATVAPILLQSATDDVQRQCARLILDAADRAKAMVKQVLTFSRKDGGGREPVRLDELVRASLRMVSAGLPATIHCRTEIGAVPAILANQGQLFQVLLNLVTNAGQAIGDRKGSVTIEVAADAGLGVRLSVEDDGPGMDEQTRRRIFEPFFTTKAASEGTGLGLSVVRGIVNDHDGSIAVTSAPGQGTRFDLCFPVHAG